MASPIVAEIISQANTNVDVERSAVNALNGVAQKVADAVAQALANGATAEELAPVQAVSDAMKQSANELAAAIVNTSGGQTPSQFRARG